MNLPKQMAGQLTAVYSGGNWTASNLTGTIEHTHYHLGQIVLIRACLNFVFEVMVSKFYFRQGAKKEPSQS